MYVLEEAVPLSQLTADCVTRELVSSEELTALVSLAADDEATLVVALDPASEPPEGVLVLLLTADEVLRPLGFSFCV